MHALSPPSTGLLKASPVFAAFSTAAAVSFSVLDHILLRICDFVLRDSLGGLDYVADNRGYEDIFKHFECHPMDLDI